MNYGNCKWCGGSLRDRAIWDDFCSERCKHQYANAKGITPSDANWGGFGGYIKIIVIIIFLSFLFKAC